MRTLTLPTHRSRPGTGDALDGVCNLHAGVQRGDFGSNLCARAGTAVLAAKSSAFLRSRAGSCAQYSNLLHYEYELAVLYAGNDHELSDPDAWVGHTQFLVGSCWHGFGCGFYPRHFAT